MLFMIRSAYYKQQAEKYEGIKAQVSQFSVPAQQMLEYIAQAKPYIEEIVICYESVDKGKLDNLSVTFETCIGVINAVIVECQGKIDEYMALYYSALEIERLEQEKFIKTMMQ